ncbi:MAG: alpha/beta hydrolase [Proteobacteria bacterium]|nr:alpha/beta hydrolase [Pseudomonadota bacterium]
MPEPRLGSVRYLLGAAFYSMAYAEWGDRDAPPVVCLHGLTRNGRDFDVLAARLARRHRVICPDFPGRGGSDWLPGSLYQPPSYVQALSHLLSAIGRPVSVVGTSLGGVVAIMVAVAHGQPIRRIVLNDIGAFIPGAALRRIRDYLVTAEGDAVPAFADIAAVERHLREVHAPFGPLTDAQWAHMARHSVRKLADGRLALHYDPAIADPMRAAEPEDVDLWTAWSAVSVPVLVVKGAHSDILLPDTAERMLRRPRTELHVVPDAGHAPALMDEPTVEAIDNFLAKETA